MLNTAQCSRCHLLKDEQDGRAEDKGAGPKEEGVGMVRPSKAAAPPRTPEGKELRRQISMGYDAPLPPQARGQGATSPAEVKEEKGGEAEWGDRWSTLPCLPCGPAALSEAHCPKEEGCQVERETERGRTTGKPPADPQTDR